MAWIWPRRLFYPTISPLNPAGLFDGWGAPYNILLQSHEPAGLSNTTFLFFVFKGKGGALGKDMVMFPSCFWVVAALCCANKVVDKSVQLGLAEFSLFILGGARALLSVELRQVEGMRTAPRGQMVQHRWSIRGRHLCINQVFCHRHGWNTCAGTIQGTPGEFFQPSSLEEECFCGAFQHSVFLKGCPFV